MLPGVLDLTMYQGDSFEILVVLRESVLDELSGEMTAGAPINLGQATARAQFRPAVDAAEFVAFSCFIPDQAVEANHGQVLVTLSPAQTVSLPGTGFWDLEVTHDDGSVHTYLRGAVTVEREVTR